MSNPDNIFKFKNIFKLEVIYKLIVVLTIILFIIIIGFLFNAFLTKDMDTIIKLLVPTGIILSAALASTSVMKSIYNSNLIEQRKTIEKNEKVKNKLKLYLKLIHSFISMYALDFKEILDEKIVLEAFIKTQEEYLLLLLNDDDIKSIEGSEIIRIIVYLEMNIDMTKKVLYSDMVKINDLKNLIERNFTKIEEIIEEINSKHDIYIPKRK